MSERYPGYDVLAKRNTPSWNETTRRVIDERLAQDPHAHQFFTDEEWPTLQALCRRIVPQAPGRTCFAPLAAMIDAKLVADAGDGYRHASMPDHREAWRRGLRALDQEAQTRHGARFHALEPAVQDELLKAAQRGDAHAEAWGDMRPEEFFKRRVLHDVVGAYYAHPRSWNEIGFGGPASPRGYVRMQYDRRDPWEAAEARPGQEERIRKLNARVG